MDPAEREGVESAWWLRKVRRGPHGGGGSRTRRGDRTQCRHIGLGVFDEYHTDFGNADTYFLTYTLERSATAGELRPEFGEGDITFQSVENISSMTDRIRDSDRGRIEMAVEPSQTYSTR